MALSTYTDLQETALDVIGRTGDAGLTAYVPVAITLVEAKLNRNLRVAEMEANAIGASTNGLLALPADYLAWRRVEAVPYGPLDYVTPDYGSSEYPSVGSGAARFFTIQGSNLATFPSYTGEVSLDYYQRIPSLSNSSPSNWLLAAHPDVYLFMTLMELNAYTKDSDAASLWNDRAAAAVDELRTADRIKRYSRVSARVKGPTP
jgi:hypothetical protein